MVDGLADSCSHSLQFVLAENVEIDNIAVFFFSPELLLNLLVFWSESQKKDFVTFLVFLVDMISSRESLLLEPSVSEAQTAIIPICDIGILLCAIVNRFLTPDLILTLA